MKENGDSELLLWGLGYLNWFYVNMEIYLGMSQAEADGIEFRGTTEGGKLKETGTSHWKTPNTGATNESRFTALPGGYRSMVNGNFVYIGTDSYWWTSSGKSDTDGWDRGLNYNLSTIDRIGSPKYDGFYVRCIKD